MYIRIYNAKILTMEQGLSIIQGELWIQDKRIIYIGDGIRGKDAIYYEKNINDTIWDREIDADGNLVMPGFKNAHTHSAMTFLRSYADDMNLQDWLNVKVFPKEAKLTEEDIYHLTKLANLEYLTSGITGIMEMYLTPESIARACEDTGMRCVQVGGVNNFSQSVEMVEEMYEKLNQKDSLNSFMIGTHSEYLCSEELLEKISGLVHKYQAPFFCHNSETRREVDECIEKTGLTPTEHMDRLGLFDCGGGGYHCVYLSEHDIQIFEKRGLTVVTNPASNLKLASGIAPLEKYRKAGLNIAIGTDGPASNNCLDMFREMFLVTALAKYTEDDASAMDANHVLEMATVGGARAMGLHESDVLKVGNYADLIMLDLKQPNMQPINNITKNIVYSGSKNNIKMTMINGKILYENGEFFVGESVTDIYEKANEIALRLNGE